jgi:hypothetical protein
MELSLRTKSSDTKLSGLLWLMQHCRLFHEAVFPRIITTLRLYTARERKAKKNKAYKDDENVSLCICVHPIYDFEKLWSFFNKFSKKVILVQLAHRHTLASGSRVFLEKSIVARPVKKFPAFYGTRRFTTRVHNSLSVSHFLSNFNQVHIL